MEDSNPRRLAPQLISSQPPSTTRPILRENGRNYITCCKILRKSKFQGAGKMSEYTVSKVYPSDKRGNAQVEKLLLAEGIRRDKNLDYTCGVYDDDYNIIATGSCFGNTLRCMAVSHEHQGEGLMNEVVSHLVQHEYERGINHLFLYTIYLEF